MGNNQKVKIVEICKVSPQLIENSVLDSPESLPLTFLDLLWLRSPPVERLFFFELPDTNTIIIVPRLKRALSLTLRHFLPLAGNIVWPRSSGSPYVQYLRGADGVSVTVAETVSPDLDFDVLSGRDEAFESGRYHHLVPTLAVSGERAAVLALQVTLFPGKGFSIGITIHHAVADGKAVHVFMKSWAHFCKYDSSTSLPAGLRPFYDKTVLKDPAGLKELFSGQWTSFDGPDNRSLKYRESELPPDSVRGSFTLDRRDIEKIRRLVEPKVVGRPSSFCLVCAYVWVCVVKAELLGTLIADDDEEARIGIPCDCRHRLEPPVPAEFFGNCVGGSITVAGAKELAGNLSDGLGLAVKSIGESLKGFEGGELMNGVENWVSVMNSHAPFQGVYCSIAGSHRFEVYGTDFGWGRPKKTDVVSIDRTRAINFQDSRDGEGFEICLALKKRDMEAFASFLVRGLDEM